LSTPGLPQIQAGLENPNRQALIRLQAELSAFVHQECQAQRDQHHREWRKPIAERVKSGRCITDLSLQNIREGGRILRFKVQENESDFREGDLIQINHGDPLDAICTGEFYREDLDSIEVILRKPGDWQPRESNSLFTLDHSYIDLEKFFQRAIEQLGETEIGRERILPLLTGDRKPKTDGAVYEDTIEDSQLRGLNEAQAEAIALASSTDLCQLIQGPPGTGKTHVLAEIVRNRLARGERILVCAATHRAIHNALNKIAPLCPGLVCKIDSGVYDPTLQVKQYEYFHLCPFAESGGGYVIGATPYAVQGRLRDQVEFDTVIMDEAGQITLPLAVMAMLAGKTYIIIGDHKQLPPVIVSRPMDELCDLSIFNRLHRRGFDERLNVTYRMNQELTAWPSEQFYLGDLTSHEKVANRRIQYPRESKNYNDILAPEDPIVFVETSPGEDKTSSHEEAILIRDLIDELISERQLSPHDIAVVVPFRRQARLIRRNLRERGALHSVTADLVIDTVERMQGQERELIIVGLTASDSLYIQSREEFLFQPNRLNVAVTRAKSKLIIIGSRSLLDVTGQTSGAMPEALERFAQFQTLVRSAKHVRHDG
jgi:DNA replication ATP-dependent helicase Dna2